MPCYYAAILRGSIKYCTRPSVHVSVRPFDRLFHAYYFYLKQKAVETSNLVDTWRWRRVTTGANLRFKGQGHWGQKCESFCAYIIAFDSINHPILFQKLLQLNIPPDVLLWIINFLSSRTQAVSSFGQISGWLSITQSIIQGSGIGPYLYMIYASDL